ncbi:MAG: EamA family transporter [Clostridiales bacterium]|nr:EamA family transporter [Clostridiales bacterium]
MNTKLILVLSVLFASCGQILFKKGMSFFKNLTMEGGILPFAAEVIRAVFSPFVFSGLVLYALSTLLWLLALTKTELTYAYPFTLLTFILVMVGSYLIFHDVLPVNRIIGAGIVIIGVIVVSLK